MSSKRLSLAEAVAEHLRPGSSVVMGACLESLIPFAAGHEIIRQGIGDLTLVGPISDILFDQLIGAGCAARVTAAWVGNVSAGLGHNYRRACEEGIPRFIEVHDHSNFSVALALLAGGLGAPYIPIRSLLGTDLLKTNPSFEVAEWRGEPIVLVPALQPDVAVLHVQRASEDGHAHVWGHLGISEEAALASRGVLITAEEIVPRAVILSDPNRVLAPAHKVLAVVEAPGGAHPSPVQGYYNRDHRFYHEYHQASRSPEGFRAWLEEWVLSVPDQTAYFEKLGARWRALSRRRKAPAAEVDYGY